MASVSLTRRAGTALLGPILHRGDLARPRGAGRMLVSLNQRLFEQGHSPPWVFSRAECQSYWASPADPVNQPSEYASKSVEIVDLLNSFWSPDVSAECSVLEVGCNAGANLERLRQLGYSDLRGVEINGAAIDELGARFPDLASSLSVDVGPFEEVLPKLPNDSVDVVCTMAVLMHVHPSSGEVFAQMARIARRFICVLEAETATTPIIFARNYRRVFGSVGCAQLKSALITGAAFPDVDPGYHGYVARLFAPT